MVKIIGLDVVVNDPPAPPPTLMPSVADRFPIVKTNVQAPFPIGVTVYVAGSVVEFVVMETTGLHPNGSIVGSGAFAVVELTTNVCAPLPAPVNARLLGVTATEFEPGTGPLVGGAVGKTTGAEPLLPPPQADRQSAAPTTAKNGCKRESIEPDLLAMFVDHALPAKAGKALLPGSWIRRR
jgi:hypothetical protein